MNVTLTEIGSIKPYEKNAKKHPKKQINQIVASITAFGWGQPIAVDRDGVIIAGHGRYEAARAMKLAEVPVVTLNLTEEQARAYRLADNRLNESEWDMELAIPELKSLTAELFDLTGFDRSLIAEPVTEDDVPEVPVEANAKRGEVYRLGEHRLMCGDATSTKDLGILMGDSLADMVFTDPPYGVSYVGKTKDALTIKNDALDEGNLSAFWGTAYENMRNFLKNGGSVYAAVPPGPLNAVFAERMHHYGDLRQSLVWVKDVFVMGRSDYHYRHEPILYGWKEGGKHRFFGGRDKDTIWEVSRPKRSEEHPTMKPVELVARAINNSSEAGDLVMDTFAGSGSTLIACEQLGRRCYALEIDPRYVDVIIARWEKLTGKKAEKLKE